MPKEQEFVLILAQKESTIYEKIVNRISDVMNFLKAKGSQNLNENYVVENPNANQVVIKQLSTRFMDRLGNDAWSYINAHRLALYEILHGESGRGLANYRETVKVMRDLSVRFRDEEGMSATDYLNSHPEMTRNLFKPTHAYIDELMKRSRAVAVVMRKENAPA